MSPPVRLLPLLLAGFTCAPGSLAAAGAGAVDWRFPPAQPPPFTAQELESAVSLREVAEDAGEGATVAVGWERDGTVRASALGRRRVVALGEARGPEAARLVAIAVMDLLRPLPALQAPAVEETGAAAAGQPAGGPGRSGVAVLAAVDHGATSAGFAIEPSIRATAGAGRVGFELELGYGQGRGRVDGQTVLLHMLPARVGLALRERAWAFHAGLLVRPYLTRAPAGGGAWGTLYGGHLAVERAFPLSGGLALLAAAGVDLQANAIELQVRGRTLLRSGRVVPMARLGLAWRAW